MMKNVRSKAGLAGILFSLVMVFVQPPVYASVGDSETGRTGMLQAETQVMTESLGLDTGVLTPVMGGSSASLSMQNFSCKNGVLNVEITATVRVSAVTKAYLYYDPEEKVNSNTKDKSLEELDELLGAENRSSEYSIDSNNCDYKWSVSYQTSKPKGQIVLIVQNGSKYSFLTKITIPDNLKAITITIPDNVKCISNNLSQCVGNGESIEPIVLTAADGYSALTEEQQKAIHKKICDYGFWADFDVTKNTITINCRANDDWNWDFTEELKELKEIVEATDNNGKKYKSVEAAINAAEGDSSITCITLADAESGWTAYKGALKSGLALTDINGNRFEGTGDTMISMDTSGVISLDDGSLKVAAKKDVTVMTNLTGKKDVGVQVPASVTAIIGIDSDDIITVDKNEYVPAEDLTLFAIDESKNVSLKQGAAWLKDGADITTKSGKYVSNPADSGDDLIKVEATETGYYVSVEEADHTFRIGDMTYITASKDVKINVGADADELIQGALRLDPNESITVADIPVLNKGTNEIIVSVDGEERDISLLKNGSVLVGNKIYTASSDGAVLAVSRDGTVTVISGSLKKEAEALNASRFTAIAPTSADGTDGKISGVDDTMEYSTDGGKTWISVAGTEITGLSAGEVWIRMKETSDTTVGEAVKVTVPAYETSEASETSGTVAKTPKTGDGNYPVLFGSLLVCSVLALGIVSGRRKKQNEE